MEVMTSLYFDLKGSAPTIGVTCCYECCQCCAPERLICVFSCGLAIVGVENLLPGGTTQMLQRSAFVVSSLRRNTFKLRLRNSDG